jgi:hypothetical protein
MRQWLHSHLTYANVMATVAVFLALGGGMAFALARNSVGTRQIKPHAVRPSDIAAGAVTSKKIRSGQVGAAAFATIRQRSSARKVIAPQDTGGADVQCKKGEQYLAGGSDAGYGDLPLQIIAARFDPPNGWAVFAYNPSSSSNANVTAHVYCLAP